MATKTQKIRLSIFLIVSSTVLLGFFIVLVGNQLVQRMDKYYIEYKDISVTGLDPGAAVKYHGVQVGRVTSLSVKDAATIQIEIEVEKGTPIMQDTEAIMSLVGITGLKFVELIGGSVESEKLPVGGTIIAGQSVFETITGQAEIMIAKLEQVLNNLNIMIGPKTTESLQVALTSFTDMTVKIDEVLSENRQHFNTSVTHLDSLMSSLVVTANKVNDTVDAVNAVVKSEKIETSLSNITAITDRLRTQIDSLRLVETVDRFQTFLENSNNMVMHYDLLVMRARDDVLRSMSNLEEALDNLREATDVIRDNPSVLLRGRQTSGDMME